MYVFFIRHVTDLRYKYNVITS